MVWSAALCIIHGHKLVEGADTTACYLSCCLRRVLMTLDPRAAHALLSDIFTCTVAATVTAGGELANVAPHVAEQLLKLLPVSYLFCAGIEDTQRMLQTLVERSILTVVQYGGETSSPELPARSPRQQGATSVGCAVAVLYAVAGSEDVGSTSATADQCVEWLAVRSNVTNNVALGTALLRWISSVSEHIQTLLCGNGASAPSEGRLNRASALLDAIAVLQRCFWSHRIPRAVQAILCKAALCCLRAATATVPQCSHCGPRDRFVMTAMEYAADAMRLVGGPTIAEQSIEVWGILAQQLSLTWR
jgi:hypothetical protein